MLISQASSERMLQDNETAQDKQEKSLAQRVTAYQIKKVLEINKQTNKQTKHKIGDKSSCAFLTLCCPEEWSEKGRPFSGFSASTLRDNNGVGGCAIPCIYLAPNPQP
jgi:hypothetical protein